MAIDPRKWTTKTNEAIGAAGDMARRYGNPEVTPDHVMFAVTSQEGTIVAALGMAVHASEVTCEQLTAFHLPLLLEASERISTDWQHFQRLPSVQVPMSPDGIEPYLPTSGY